MKLQAKHKNMFAALSAAVLVSSLALPVKAEDAKTFQEGVDTILSMRYQTVKEGKKSDKQCLAVYKILDIQKSSGSYGNADVVPQAGDVVELAFTCDLKSKEPTSSGSLPWAEVESDGMVKVHMPKRYIRLRATTSAEKIWRIDNKENEFAVVKPKGS